MDETAINQLNQQMHDMGIKCPACGDSVQYFEHENHPPHVLRDDSVITCCNSDCEADYRLSDFKEWNRK